jgi:molybdopterin-containing oxidoreductase family iron-sulfur binding subunit
VNDGEAITACQEACPAGAIIFGDTNDPNSRVSKARMGERGFRVLSDLNVRPQVTYLAKVRNVKDSSAKKHH